MVGVNIGIALGGVIVGRRIKLMFPDSVSEAPGFEVVVPFVVLAGMLVGVVGMPVGVVGMLVVIVGIGAMTAGGLIISDIVPIDRRARPSSGSTEIDAFLLERR